MDLFQIPDDYKPQKPLTDTEAEDITNYLKGHPLFLKELPEDISSNEHLVALQALKQGQEEDPEVVAEHLNKQANARLKQGPNSPYYVKDAYAKYTEAINLKPKNPTLLAKLHCNRAMINLKFKNFGKVIEDCKLSLSIDPTYTKAYYRMAKAYISIKKYKQCIELLSNKTDPDLKAVLKEAVELKAKDEQLEKNKEQKQQFASNKIEQYFKAKKWRLGKRSQQLPEGVQIQFIENEISIPVIVFYPEFGQFDLIAKTGENQKIEQSLSQLFADPLPWDTKGEYKNNTLEIFTEVEEAVLLKLPKQATINDIACRVPIRGAIQIFILTNNSFGDMFKTQYKIY